MKVRDAALDLTKPYLLPMGWPKYPLGIEIYHGDAAEVVAELEGFDLVVTDPPYAMGGIDGEWRLTAEVAIALRDAAKNVKRWDGAMVVLAASSGRSVEFMSSAVGLPLKRVLTWHRPDARTAARSGWRFDTVLALVFGKVPSLGGSSSFISAASPKPSGHKAEIPDEVADWLLAPWATVERWPFTVCDRACPPASELHVADRQWIKHAYAIVGRLLNRAPPVAEPVAQVCGF